MKQVTALLTVMAVLGGIAPTQAGVLRETKSDTDWQFLLSPYLWGVNLRGTSRVGLLPEVDVDASFSDILDNLRKDSLLPMMLVALGSVHGQEDFDG